jgi:site-specific recombinase XerC
VVNLKKLYNENIKIEYLMCIPENRRTVYKYALCRSYDTEDVVGKDLFEFNTNEIKDALINADHSTFNSIKLTLHVFEDYINWAIKSGKTQSNINPILSIKNDELKTYLSKKKILFSKYEIQDMQKKMVNAQDKVILQLLFEGVNGHGLSELLNLTQSDVDQANQILKLNDDKYGKRSVKVSEKCLTFVMEALNQTHYQNKNGTSMGNNPELPLVKNNYVLRTATTRVQNFKRADKHLIYRRISTIADFFGYKYLTAKNIEKSGMIAFAVVLYLERKKLDNLELSIIGNQFGVRKVVMNGHEIFNFSLLKEFINATTIFDLYNINIT